MSQEHPQKKLGKGMLTIGWIVGLILLTLYFTQWQNRRVNPNSMPEASRSEGVNELVLQRNFQHHYVVTGSINGKSVTFLVDTGATRVSVPMHLAEELGLKQGAQGYAVTANGTIATYATTINQLQIGSIGLQEVAASINPGMETDSILLGMSALKNVEFTHRDGTLTLRQYY